MEREAVRYRFRVHTLNDKQMLTINIHKKSPTNAFTKLVQYAEELVSKNETDIEATYELLYKFREDNKLGDKCNILLYRNWSNKLMISLQYGNDGCANVHIKYE